MVDNEYKSDDYRSPKISTGALMKNFKMLKFVPDQLKTKKMCKHGINKLSLAIGFLLIDIRLCNKTIPQNSGTLESVRDCYKKQKMCNPTVDN